MQTSTVQPRETLPRIGIVENPAIFSDGDDVLICYEIAPVDGGGNVILEFEGVFHFEQNSMNIRDLGKHQYPIEAWNISEILGSDRTERWRASKSRFWMIAFNDVTVEIVFQTIRIVLESRRKERPCEALKAFLRASGPPR
ncbi:hypothetical protein [Sulfitobacter sp. M368]|uniref:hypothetical protein n=1 Tax=Sulfitobacter sp. M368 TaxID=2867021 RepID=UPI0021A54329|nr:hypothetical protein [Sulfitobacter sp. M368]UWR14617.1 hypothetical protein K3754_15175 [Sulfitobacter sp. M368]